MSISRIRSLTPHLALIAAAGLVLCFVTAAFGQSKRPAPKRIPRITTLKQPPKIVTTVDERPKTFGLSIEKYVSSIEVTKDGSATQTWEILQRYRTATAVAVLGTVQRIFNSDLEDVEISEAYILKPDGRKVILPPDAIEIKRTPQSEAAPAFSSLMMATVKFTGIEVGDAGFYRFRLRTKRPYFDGHFDSVDYLASIYDWESVEINLKAPRDYPIFTEAIGLDGGRLSDEGDHSRWQWKKTGLKALEIEPLMFDPITTSPRVMMTTFKDFDELARAYWKNASKRAEVTPAVEQKVSEITKGLTAPDQQAAAIYQWVNKNIRYLSIIMDKSGWIPNSADHILANGYGDCKDYSTILHAMLKAKGIESHPVLIRSDMGTWFPSVAAPDYFNHVVLYIPSLGLFADATAPNTRLGLIPQQIVGKKALLAGERTGIIETARDRPEDNQVVSQVKIIVDANGDLRATSANTLKGRSEILFRPIFSEITVETDAFIPAMLSYYGLSGTGRLTKVSNPFKVGEAFQIESEVTLPSYTTLLQDGQFNLPIGVNLMSTLSLADFLKPEKRSTPLVLGAAAVSETYRIQFPADVVVTLPTESGHKNATGSFAQRFRMVGNEVEVIREVIIAKDVISPAEYPLARELLTKASDAFQLPIKYRAPAKYMLDKSKTIAARPVRRSQPARPPQLGPLPPAEVRRLEARLAADPNDVDSRLALVRHYSGWQPKETAARSKARLTHRLWLIEHHPHVSATELMLRRGPASATGTAEYSAIKAAWLKQVDANRSDLKIRMNAFDALKYNEREVAAKLLMDGLEVHPDDPTLPLAVSQLYENEPDGVIKESPDEKRFRQTEQLKSGRLALTLLKQERSEGRDTKRLFLLQKLSRAAFDLDDHDEASRLALELILDFGQDSDAYGYDDASHIGNIVLGRIALRKKDVAKAKDHLMIAIKAPLRRARSWLGEIDTNLARELFDAGEKDVVAEYFRLCQGLSNFVTEKELFKDQMRALRLWQDQIKTGKRPSFDFYKL